MNQVNWRVVRSFPEAGQPNPSGAEVRVLKSDHYPVPRYRVVAGTVLKDGRFITSVQPMISGQQTIQSRIDGSLDALLDGLAKAKSFIVQDSDWEGTKWVEEREKKDREKANFGKPQVKVTGKTAKKKAKLAARAASSGS